MKDKSKKSPPHVHPSKVLFPLGLGTALSLMGDATLYTVLPTHTADAGITLAAVGIMLGINRAVRLFLNGPAGVAYDRWPRRRIFVPALFVGALSTALYAATHGFWPLLIGRMLWGLAWSGIWVGGARIILDVTTPQNRGWWMGAYQTWFFSGAALGAFVGGVFTDWLGYTATMWVGAGVTALGGLVAAWRLPETAGFHAVDTSPSVPGPPLPEAKLIKKDPPPQVRKPLGLAMALQGLNRFVISGMLTATMGLLVQAHLSDSPLGVATLTGFVMSGQTVFSIAAAPLSGRLSDKLESRWRVIRWGLLAGVIGLALLGGTLPAGILLGALLIAAAKGNIQSLVATLIGDYVLPAQQGRAIGVLHTVGDFGSAIGPPIAYLLLPWMELRGIYWLCAGLFLVGLLSTLRFTDS